MNPVFLLVMARLAARCSFNSSKIINFRLVLEYSHCFRLMVSETMGNVPFVSMLDATSEITKESRYGSFNNVSAMNKEKSVFPLFHTPPIRVTEGWSNSLCRMVWKVIGAGKSAADLFS